VKIEQDSHDGAYPKSSLTDDEDGWKYSINVETMKIKADVSCILFVFHIV
jgi:hypothetical protein